MFSSMKAAGGVDCLMGVDLIKSPMVMFMMEHLKMVSNMDKVNNIFLMVILTKGNMLMDFLKVLAFMLGKMEVDMRVILSKE